MNNNGLLVLGVKGVPEKHLAHLIVTTLFTKITREEDVPNDRAEKATNGLIEHLSSKGDYSVLHERINDCDYTLVIPGDCPLTASDLMAMLMEEMLLKMSFEDNQDLPDDDIPF